MGRDRWQLLRYKAKDGSDPVWDFITKVLSEAEQGQFKARVTELLDNGLGTRGEVLEKLGNNLYALRLPNTPNNPRFFLCAVTPMKFVIVHAYPKHTRKIPPAEEGIARKRVAEVESNPKKFII